MEVLPKSLPTEPKWMGGSSIVKCILIKACLFLSTDPVFRRYGVWCSGHYCGL